MNYGDHNFIEIIQQTKLQVALVVSSSMCRASQVRRVDNVDIAKMHGLDTSYVSSRVESSLVEFGLIGVPFFPLMLIK